MRCLYCRVNFQNHTRTYPIFIYQSQWMHSAHRSFINAVLIQLPIYINEGVGREPPSSERRRNLLQTPLEAVGVVLIKPMSSLYSRYCVYILYFVMSIPLAWTMFFFLGKEKETIVGKSRPGIQKDSTATQFADRRLPELEALHRDPGTIRDTQVPEAQPEDDRGHGRSPEQRFVRILFL